MILFKDKYSLLVLLTFALLAVTSCRKGDEPIPRYDEVNYISEDVITPLSKAALIDAEEGDDVGNGTVVGGDDGEDDDGGNGTVIGGDDGEDDDGGSGGTRSGVKSGGGIIGGGPVVETGPSEIRL